MVLTQPTGENSTKQDDYCTVKDFNRIWLLNIMQIITGMQFNFHPQMRSMFRSKGGYQHGFWFKSVPHKGVSYVGSDFINWVAFWIIWRRSSRDNSSLISTIQRVQTQSKNRTYL